MNRAFPVCSVFRDDWEDWEAWEPWDFEAPATFATASALLVALPFFCFARVLSFAGSSATLGPRPKAKGRVLTVKAAHARTEERQRHCCKHLRSQGFCLHGSVDGSGHLACWYCPCRFSEPEALNQHGEAEHSAAITAWIRKRRKAKAATRRQAAAAQAAQAAGRSGRSGARGARGAGHASHASAFSSSAR